MAEPNRTPPVMDSESTARFWSKVDRCAPDECWPWKYGSTGMYGHFKAGGRSVGSHRLAYFLHHGNWPTMLICHRCDNPPCCNPAHLFEGTSKDNSADCVAKGRIARLFAEKHWSRKHPDLISRGDQIGGSIFTTEQVQEIFRLYLAGNETHQSIADKMNAQRETISIILRGRNWKHLNPDPDRLREISRAHRAASARKSATLTIDNVREIRLLIAEGRMKKTEIAKQFRVTSAMIGHIAHGRSWVDVT